mgnify:CR=1 FL=1
MKKILPHLYTILVIVAIVFIPYGLGMLFPIIEDRDAPIILWTNGVACIFGIGVVIVIYIGIYKEFFKK